MPDPLLQIDNVGFRHRGSDWRLGDVGLSVSGSEMVGLIGPNGSGKSTLLKIAAGILAPDSGTVQLMNRDIRRMSRRSIAKQLGFLPQDVVSSLDYSAEQVVAMGRFAHLKGAGFLGQDDLRIIERSLEYTETVQYRHRRISQLSGGERQRVLLASVLAQEPAVLLLDGPTSGLDLHHQSAFFDLLSTLSDEGMAVLAVTHDLNLASLFCQRLVLLQNGRIVKAGCADEVIRPEVLAEVYRASVLVERHPVSDRPMVLPLTGQAGSDRREGSEG